MKSVQYLESFIRLLGKKGRKKEALVSKTASFCDLAA